MPNRQKSRDGQPPAHLLWAVGTSLMPAFINDGVTPPFRPLVAIVVNGHGMVIGHGVSLPEDPLSGVEDALVQAIGKPKAGFGSGTTPLRVTVDQEALLPLVRRLLPEVPAKVGRCAELEEMFQALPAMQAMDSEPEARGIQGMTSLLDGDLTPADLNSFFAACAVLYQLEPWGLFADDQCLFQLTSRTLAMHQWCGSVIGQAGESYGVLMFESRREQRRFTDLAQSAVDNNTLGNGLLPHQRAISFEPLDVLSRELAAEIHEHRWPVACGDAYPLPLHIDPDFLAVPSSRLELGRLEAMARGLTRLIETTPHLEDYWNWIGQAPLRRQYRVPVQDRGLIALTLTLIPPEEDGQEEG